MRMLREKICIKNIKIIYKEKHLLTISRRVQQGRARKSIHALSPL